MLIERVLALKLKVENKGDANSRLAIVQSMQSN